MTSFHIFSGARLYQTQDISVKRITCIFNYVQYRLRVCAVQAESVCSTGRECVQYRLRVCSTGRRCAVQAEGNSLLCILQPEPHPLSLYYHAVSVICESSVA